MKRALIFSGGGSRGAYEIGAWKALSELGIEFQAAYGTSIGAINAALVAQGDLEIAEHLWENIDVSKVASLETPENFSIDSMISSKRDIIPFLLENAKNLGVDTRPLVELINNSIIEGQVRASGMDLNVTTLRIPYMTPVQISLRDMQPGSLTDWLMASAACFPVFPMWNIEGSRYLDGGYYDNLPIDKALSDGMEELVCVDIHPNFTHPEFERLPNITVIHPKRALCGFMDFRPKLIKRSRMLGYCDVMKRYGHLDGFRYAFLRVKRARALPYAKEYAAHLARLDAQMIGRIPFTKGQQVNAPLYSAIEAELPDGRYSETDVFLRGLELATGVWKLRDDVVYQPKILTARLLRYVNEETSDAELSANTIREHAGTSVKLTAYLYRCFRRGDECSGEILKVLSEHPTETAAALYLCHAKENIL